MPRALSGRNKYGLRGPGEHDGSVVIRVGGDVARYRELCAEATVAATFGVPCAVPYERGRSIVLCRDLRAAWAGFRHIE